MSTNIARELDGSYMFILNISRSVGGSQSTRGQEASISSPLLLAGWIPTTPGDWRKMEGTFENSMGKLGKPWVLPLKTWGGVSTCSLEPNMATLEIPEMASWQGNTNRFGHLWTGHMKNHGRSISGYGSKSSYCTLMNTNMAGKWMLIPPKIWTKIWYYRFFKVVPIQECLRESH